MKRKSLLAGLGSLVGAALILFLLSSAAYHLGPFRFRARLAPGWGRTRIELPPVGAVEARTHLAPLDLVLTLESVDMDRLQEVVAGPEAKRKLLLNMRESGRRIAAHFFLRSLLLAAAGGAWGASWLKRGWRRWAKGAGIAAGTWVAVAALTVATFDVQAFQNPAYSGVLKGAPWMLGLAQTAWQRLDKLGADVRVLTQNLRQTLDRANAIVPLAGLQDDLKVLHISDLHNNPLGLNFVEQIRNDFAPDFIVDTGDLTDFGTTLEEGLL
ncbi:MAG TPA: metallophosphoesterase, partial [Firmicutes bacterium]|nr:metallophosphoesterase [Bacillota bacterium]